MIFSLIILVSKKPNIQLISTFVVIFIPLIYRKFGYFAGLIFKFKYLLISLLVLQLLFRKEGAVMLDFGVFKIYSEGVLISWFSVNRILFCLVSIIILKTVSQESFLYRMRKWHFPKELILVVLLILDYLDEFLQKFQKIKNQLFSRGFVFNKMTLREKIELFENITLPVLAVTLYQVKDKAQSLELMQYDKTDQPTVLYEEKNDLVNQLSQLLIVVIFFVWIVIEV